MVLGKNQFKVLISISKLVHYIKFSRVQDVLNRNSENEKYESFKTLKTGLLYS